MRLGALCCWFTLAAAFLALGGCGGRSAIESSRTTAAGKVTLAGKPLRGGCVTLVSSSDPQLRITAMIQDDGTFRVLDAPRGDVKIAVDTETLRMGAPAELYVKIPERYANPETSALTSKITPEGPALSIDLAP